MQTDIAIIVAIVVVVLVAKGAFAWFIINRMKTDAARRRQDNAG